MEAKIDALLARAEADERLLKEQGGKEEDGATSK